jgi:hypothetical protein
MRGECLLDEPSRSLMATKDCSDKDCFIKIRPGGAQNQIVADFSTKVCILATSQGNQALETP